MNQDRSEKGLLKKFPKRPTAGNMRRSYNRNPKKMICGAIGAVALFGSGAAAYSLSRFFSEGSNVSDFNSTNFTTISPYQFESSTIGVFNSTGWNGSASTSTGSTLAYSAYASSSTTVRNENVSNTFEKDDSNFQEDLLKNGSNINTKEHIKTYEIDFALYNEDNNQLRTLLMQTNINVNEINSPLGPPITIAIIKGNVESVRLLLGHPYIDVNKKNKNGDYPIHEAIYKCNRSILNLLLKDGRVNINVKNSNNQDIEEVARALPDSQCKKEIIKDIRDAINKYAVDKWKKENKSSSW
ncbi:ankyrin repeat domain-containing protein [Candidatus Cardinium hertigii]|uniref:ankyrin repeat domain-containing protein n=1 Tax=Candidatus Cardinium hertigii TaxID=247481 RepID=UPI003D7ED71B